MKKIATYWIMIVSLLILFIGCSDTMGEPDHSLTEVKTLIEPMNDNSLVLLPAASASTYFEWEHADIEGGPAIYQIAFDRVEGDFSAPLYLAFTGNNGDRKSTRLNSSHL